MQFLPPPPPRKPAEKKDEQPAKKPAYLNDLVLTRADLQAAHKAIGGPKDGESQMAYHQRVASAAMGRLLWQRAYKASGTISGAARIMGVRRRNASCMLARCAYSRDQLRKDCGE